MCIRDSQPTFYYFLGSFENVPDPRKPYNQKHRFLDIFNSTILATICGADTCKVISEWGKSNLDWLLTFLPLENGIPSHDTFNRVFQLISPEEFHRAFRTWVQSIASELEGVIAIDGKTIRGSREAVSNTRPSHIVSAWAQEQGLVLGQLKVEEKTNEITAIPELLKTLAI